MKIIDKSCELDNFPDFTFGFSKRDEVFAFMLLGLPRTVYSIITQKTIDG